MPVPVSVLVASDNQLAAYLADLERRIADLERRIVGHGQTATIGGISIRNDGGNLVAVRLSDGATATIADFTQGG